VARQDPTNEDPAWTDRDLADPHTAPDKSERVRRMFAAIAHRYDLNNRLHSFWRDQAWRRYAVRAADVHPGDAVLDAACGTGDLTIAFAKSAAARVVGVDFTPEMLEIAEKKKQRLDPTLADRIAYTEGDVQELPFPDGSFDVVSIALGIRNVTDPPRAIRQFARVLRPGGRLVIVEFERPGFWFTRVLTDVYCRRVMPKTATLIAHDKSGAYKYLPVSVVTFMTRQELCRAIEDAGFENVTVRTMTLGVCVCYRASLPVY